VGFSHLGEGQLRAGERKRGFGVGGGLLVALSVIVGVSSVSLKVVREGRLQVAQALLQGYGRDIGQPGGFWLLLEEGSSGERSSYDRLLPVSRYVVLLRLNA
jgi:hypothetical protein